MAIIFEKQKGEIVRRENLIRSIDSMLDTLKNGEYTLSANKISNRRSTSQNAMMWMWFTCLAMETGQDKEDFYDYYREKFLSRIVIINGQETKVSTGTSKLDTVAMTDFLNKIQADAASEFGIKLPTPEDLYWTEFENYYKRFI
jgi:hypothetical protein